MAHKAQQAAQQTEGTQSQGVAYLDGELRFVTVNQTFAALSGRAPGEHPGRTIGEVAPTLAPALEPLLRSSLESGTAQIDMELAPAPGKAGRARGHWLLSVYPVRSRSGLVVGLDVTAQSISKRPSARGRAASEVDQSLLELLIEAAPVGFALVDHEFRYLRVNERLAALNGLSAAEHLGRTAYELFPSMVERWEPLWRHAIETGEPALDHELSAVLDGQLRSVKLSYYPVRAGDGPVLGVGILVEETTEQRRLFETTREALARAEQAVRVRDAFLSIAAHELKNPLASLLGQAQLARRRAEGEGLSTATQRSLEVIGEQALRLSHMIDDLLDLSRLEQGQLSLVRAPLDLVALTSRITAEASEGNAARICLRAPEAALMVSGDADRLEQVIGNLVSNALKYSPEGGLVRVGLERRGGEAWLTVSDQGIGIPEEALPRLFEPFYRAPNAEAHHIIGIGIGLAIVREIVLQHGGSIEATSELDRGSTFTVRLPLLDDGVQ
jgi:PAS domain S-box-containing protein